jgi:hypothetical protein
MIPKKFKLYGQTINVVIDNDQCRKEEAIGLADDAGNKILLADSDVRGVRMPADTIEQTFYHEAIHHVFWKAGYKDLAKDEDLINRVSSLIHQMITTFDF